MAIADQINQFSQHILNYAMILAAVGTLSMALLELVKSVFDLRLDYNRGRVMKWTQGYPRAYAQLLLLATGGGSADPERRGLVKRITGEVRKSDVIFDQPSENMLGQFQAASNLVMDFPALYEDAYRFLMNQPASGPLAGDPSTWLEFTRKTTGQGSSAGNSKPPRRIKDANRDIEAGLAAQARARLANLLSRKLDAFQNETQYLWAELNQRVSFLLATGLLLWFMYPTSGLLSKDGLLTLILACFGGLIAPFAKDLVSALSGLNAKAT